MKRKLLFKRAAALLLSSTLVVSVPLTAGAVTVTDDGDYEIVFNNYGGTIDGSSDSKTVSFKFDSDNEVVDLTDLVGTNVRDGYYAFKGWMINGETVTTVTKDDFNGDYSLNAYASFDRWDVYDKSKVYIEFDCGVGGELADYGNYVEFPRAQFTEFTLPIPETYDGIEFLGWLEGGYYAHDSGNVREHYVTVTADDFSGNKYVIDLNACYKKLATEEDTTRVLTLDANGGTIDGLPRESIVNCTDYIGNPQDFSLMVPVNSNPELRFVGWNTEQDGSGYFVTHTGFKDHEMDGEDDPGWCDLYKYFGDENENATVYAVWAKDPVKPETDSEMDKSIAEKAVEELNKYRNGKYSVFDDNEEETADLILDAFDEGKNVTLGFVMEKDFSESAMKNKEDLSINRNILSGDVMDDPYKIFISVKADGQEIGRVKHMGMFIDKILIPIPDGMFQPNSRDVESARLFRLNRNSSGYLSTYYYEEEIENGNFVFSLSKYNDTEADNFILVGRSEMNILPYDSSSEQDATVAKNISYYGTMYRADPSSVQYESDATKETLAKVVDAYNSGKNVYGRFVFEEVQPSEEYKNQIIESCKQTSDLKDFTPLRYYKIAQYAYSGNTLLGALPSANNSVDYSYTVSEVPTLPEPDPRYSRDFIMRATIYDEEDDYYSSYNDYPAVSEDGLVEGNYYGSEADIFAFGYYPTGDYHVSFEFNDGMCSFNGQPFTNNTPSYSFNFLSEDEDLGIADFFGMTTAADLLRPYRTFQGWQKRVYDSGYVYTDITSVNKEAFGNSTYITVVPKFDETIPHNTGKYYITLRTRSGEIQNLPDLGGKITWNTYNGYGYDGMEKWNYYVGVVNSSDFTSLTLPAPTSDHLEFLGWNSVFDPESGTVQSHSATLTAADFSESDAIDLQAEFTYPKKADEEMRRVAILDCNGGTINGQEIAYYHSAADTWAKSYSMNLIVPERPGYKFKSWNTKADGTGVTVDQTGYYSVNIFSLYYNPVICDENYNVYLYAQWEFTGTPVSSVTLNKTSASLEIGSTLTLTATLLPEDAQNKTLTWTSSNAAVATVDNGKVTAVGNGTAVITAKAVGGAKAECTIKVNTLLNKSTVSADEVEFGKSVTINGKAEAGTSPYTFAYYYRKVGNSTWKTIGTAFTSTTKTTFKAPVAAEYEIKVTVKDSKNKTADKIMKVNFYQVPELENTSTVASESIDLGDTIVINGSAEGGKPQYTFAYYYKRSANTKWNQITDFTSSAKATFKPKAAADFDIKVIAKDSAGTTAEKIITVTVNDLSLKNEAYINTEKAQIGDDIRVTGGAKNGTGPYKFAFYFKRSTNSKWNKMGTEFGTATYATLVPKAAADYDLKCVVKDSTGATAEKIFKATVVESMELTNISHINTDTQVPVGKTVTISGRTVGGTKPCTYEFFFKRTANSKWNKLSYGNEKGTYAKFTPTSAASYDLKVIATDSKGAKASKVITINAVNS